MSEISPSLSNLQARLQNVERNLREEGKEAQHVILEFAGSDDPLHPQNWSLARRVWVTLMLALFNLVVTISSSIFGSAQQKIMAEFEVGEEVTILGTSLFLVVWYQSIPC